MIASPTAASRGRPTRREPAASPASPPPTTRSPSGSRELAMDSPRRNGHQYGAPNTLLRIAVTRSPGCPASNVDDQLQRDLAEHTVASALFRLVRRSKR